MKDTSRHICRVLDRDISIKPTHSHTLHQKLQQHTPRAPTTVKTIRLDYPPSSYQSWRIKTHSNTQEKSATRCNKRCNNIHRECRWSHRYTRHVVHHEFLIRAHTQQHAATRCKTEHHTATKTATPHTMSACDSHKLIGHVIHRDHLIRVHTQQHTATDSNTQHHAATQTATPTATQTATLHTMSASDSHGHIGHVIHRDHFIRAHIERILVVTWQNFSHVSSQLRLLCNYYTADFWEIFESILSGRWVAACNHLTKFLTSQLAPTFTMQHPYRADFWENFEIISC